MLVPALLFLFIHIDNSASGSDTDPSNENYRIRYGNLVSEDKKNSIPSGFTEIF